MSTWARTDLTSLPGTVRAREQIAQPNLSFRFVAWTIAFLPLNWLLGTTLLWVYAAAVVLVLSPVRISALERAFLALCAALTLSLAVGIAGGAPGDRIIASIYNLTIIGVVIAFANCGRQIGASAQVAGRYVYRAAFWCFAFQFVVIAALAAYQHATGAREVALNTLLLGAFGELPGILSQYSRVFFSIIDWTATGPQPRIYGFGIYATEGAILLLVVGLLGAIRFLSRRRFLIVICIEIAICMGLVVMGSRTTLLAYLVSLPMLAALGGRRSLNLLLLCSPIVAVVLIFGAMHSMEFGSSAFQSASESRAGSSGERFKTYTRAIELVRDENILTGLGVKPRDDSFSGVPIGSHSSMISTFTRGGLLGLAIWLGINALLLVQIIWSQVLLFREDPRIHPNRRLELAYLSRCVIVLLIWWTTEDFDAPAHQAAIAGLCLGLFWSVLNPKISASTLRHRWR